MRNELRIDERRCNGCGYCIVFCPTQCMVRELERMSSLGYALPVLTKPEQCSACGICARMCPRWAIEVVRYSEEQEGAATEEKVAALTLEPPLSGCAGCQHPTVGRIVAEVVTELGVDKKVIALENIPCSISSAFGMDFGRKITNEEIALDVATAAKRASPDAPVIVIQGYWGLSDFSLDVGALIGALIRGENLTLVLCNMPFYGPKDGRPAPANEPVEGRLEPVTRIRTPEGEKLLVGGYPLHLAELVASFDGCAYSARGTITSMKEYQRTKNYFKRAVQKQMNGSGLTFVEVLCSCSDPTYSAPIDSLRWVEQAMTARFPLGEFKVENQEQCCQNRNENGQIDHYGCNYRRVIASGKSLPSEKP